MNPDFTETEPVVMTPEQIRQHTETMRRYREHDAAARSAFRLMLALIAVWVLGTALGQL